MESVAQVGGASRDASRLVGRARLLERIVDVLASSPRRSCVLLGGPGVGTTALAVAAAERLADRGMTVGWFAGADTAVRGHDAVVVVDDLAALDADDASVVKELIRGHIARVLVTVRTPGGLVPESADDLLRSHDVEPVRVEPLDGRACAELLWRRVGGAFDVSAGIRLRRLTGGRPALLDAVLDDPDRSGAWRDGAWHPRPADVRALITRTVGRARWSVLSPAARDVVAAAVAESVVAPADGSRWSARDVAEAVASELVVEWREGDFRPAVVGLPRLLALAAWLDRREVQEWLAEREAAAAGASAAAAAIDAHLGSLVECQFEARVRAGDASAATETERAALAAAVAHFGLVGAGAQLLAIARLELLTGRAATALDLLLTVHDLDRASPEVAGFDPRGRAAAGASVAMCWLGDLDGAQRWATVYDELAAANRRPVDVIAERWRATVDSFSGRPAAAGARLEATLAAADELGSSEDIAIVAFDLARFRHRIDREIVGRARATAVGRLAPAILDFVDAAAGDDLEALMESATTLQRGGADRYAVEAWAYCAAVADARGDHRARLLAARRVRRLRREGTSGWVAAPQALRQEVCSPEELEVAALAAGGLTRREIASRLALSPGTVERHLAAVHERLAVTTLDELAAALDDMGVGNAARRGSDVEAHALRQG